VPLSYVKFEKTSKNQHEKPLTETPVFLLHGLFGSKSNWQSVAKALHGRLKQTVITVDARNHGESTQDQEHSYEAMADDLEELMESLQIPTATFVGHSMVRFYFCDFSQSSLVRNKTLFAGWENGNVSCTTSKGIVKQIVV
jgi:abhydrolase domain-containing protein 11